MFSKVVFEPRLVNNSHDVKVLITSINLLTTSVLFFKCLYFICTTVFLGNYGE